MGFFQRISLLHLELTERCNAACPMCGRTGKNGEPNPHLTGRELSLADFQGIFPREFLNELKQIRFCGNFGDPAAARDHKMGEGMGRTAPRAPSSAIPPG